MSAWPWKRHIVLALVCGMSVSTLVHHLTVILGVLSLACSQREYVDGHTLQVEFHAYTGFGLEGTPGHTGGPDARIEQMVLRLDTMALKAHHSAYIDRIAAIEDHILALPRLRTVTLETMKAEESVVLADKFPKLYASGKLRRQTCKEAWVIAQEALRNPVADSTTESVVSPLWYSDEYNVDKRNYWCVTLLCLAST